MSTATTTSAAAPKPAASETPKQDAPKIPSGSTIAVVDEDVWRVRHLSELLQKSGFRVLLLTSPNNAVQLVDARCDVVLVAQTLKGLPPAELAQALREKHGEKRPWLVMIGDDGPDPHAGFDRAVPRAIEDDALVPMLIETVEARRASTAAVPLADSDDYLES